MADQGFSGWTAIKINNALITSVASKKVVDITSIIGKIEIFKSMFRPTVTGIITLADGSGLIQSLPVVGEESLILELETPNRTKYNNIFYVYKVEDQDYDENGTHINYSLRFTSVDHYNAIINTVDQGYHQNISDIANGVLTSAIKTKNKIDIEPTNSIEKIIIPHWNCWKTMDFLRQRAVSQTYKSPYVFYEDKDGYHFASVEYMIKKNQSQANAYIYTADSYLPGAGDNGPQSVFLASQQFNAYDLRIAQKTSTAELINSGGISSQPLVIDVLDKSANTYIAKYNDATTNIKQPLGKTFNPNHSQAFANADPIQQYMMPYDSTNKSYMANNHSFRRMFATMINETKIVFNTPGDTSLDAGMIFQFNVPARYSNQKYDQELTGQYMIGTLKHGIFSGQMVTTIEAFRFGAASKVF
jgi:hypothetical protein